MKKLILAAALGLILAGCDGRDREETYDDTPPSGAGQPAQDVDRRPDRPDGGATGT